MGSLTKVVSDNKELVKEVHRLGRLGVRLEHSPKGGFLDCHNFMSYLVVKVKSKHLDHLFMN